MLCALRMRVKARVMATLDSVVEWLLRARRRSVVKESNGEGAGARSAGADIFDCLDCVLGIVCCETAESKIGSFGIVNYVL